MTAKRPNVFAVVLAAGQATRFGATKQTAKLHGVPLVSHAASTAALACDDRVLTVLGHDWDRVMAALRPGRGFVVINDNHASGIGTSIAAAARVCRGCADAMLLVLADQPLVTAQHLQALIDNWTGASDAIVATAYSGTQGPPVLFPRGAFDALSRLKGDVGARTLLQDNDFDVTTVRFDAAAIDIDTPSDLTTLA
jgi:molybdenum cofactor cytidylyltransferase